MFLADVNVHSETLSEAIYARIHIAVAAVFKVLCVLCLPGRIRSQSLYLFEWRWGAIFCGFNFRDIRLVKLTSDGGGVVEPGDINRGRETESEGRR